MTEQEQRIAIGELVEPNPLIEWNAVSPDGKGTCFSADTKREVERWLEDLPADSWAKNYKATPWKRYRDYLNDLNPCHDMEEKLTMPESARFEEMLDSVANRDFMSGQTIRINCVWHATAAHRAEAWLRVKGLWKET